MRDPRFVVLAAVVFVIALSLYVTQAWPRDTGQWGKAVEDTCRADSSSAECSAATRVWRWFQNLTQPDNPYQSCCGEADAFEADTFEVQGDHYVAVITNGKGVIPNGTRIPVPNQKMKYDNGNPTGHGIIFIGLNGQIYCYVAPGGV